MVTDLLTEPHERCWTTLLEFCNILRSNSLYYATMWIIQSTTGVNVSSKNYRMKPYIIKAREKIAMVKIRRGFDTFLLLTKYRFYCAFKFTWNLKTCEYRKSRHSRQHNRETVCPVAQCTEQAIRPLIKRQLFPFLFFNWGLSFINPEPPLAVMTTGVREPEPLMGMTS